MITTQSSSPSFVYARQSKGLAHAPPTKTVLLKVRYWQHVRVRVRAHVRVVYKACPRTPSCIIECGQNIGDVLCEAAFQARSKEPFASRECSRSVRRDQTFVLSGTTDKKYHVLLQAFRTVATTLTINHFMTSTFEV